MAPTGANKLGLCSKKIAISDPNGPNGVSKCWSVLASLWDHKIGQGAQITAGISFVSSYGAGALTDYYVMIYYYYAPTPERCKNNVKMKGRTRSAGHTLYFAIRTNSKDPAIETGLQAATVPLDYVTINASSLPGNSRESCEFEPPVSQ